MIFGILAFAALFIAFAVLPSFVKKHHEAKIEAESNEQLSR